MNEENVKLLILNLLQNWGFDTNEIILEKSFNIKLGKNVLKVDSLKQISEISPRTDILVKNESQNLFIFEIKADNVKIDDDDIKQGISYARLTETITPFVVITNGKNTRIFNSFNNEELQENDKQFQNKIKNFDYKLYIDIGELYYDATKYLIGTSPYNIEVFSKQQVISRMENIKGIDIDDEEKYIPELFVERDNLYNYFEDFLKSDKTCFSIIGESGAGKTNVICDLALKFTSNNTNYLPYFYSCHELYGSIVNNIKEDFNLNFTRQHTEEQIIKRIADISNKKTIIFFDAIDENNTQDFTIEINNFVRIAKDKNIKICFTCKDIEYNRFLNIKGNPSFIANNVFSANENKISFVINNFSDNEYRKILSTYREKFDLLEIPNEISSELKNGFILRIYAEVHKNKRKFQAQNIIEMMHEYLKQKLLKMYNNDIERDIAHNIMVEIGKNIWEKSINKDLNKFPVIYRMSDKISEKDLKFALNLKINESLPRELFENKILQKNIYEEVFISFYYTRFRDYIIGFKYLKINSLSNKDFSNLLPQLYSSNIGISIIQWYYKFAPNSHKSIIEQFFMGKVQTFINEYNCLIDKYFKEIKNVIFPNIIDKIAIGIIKQPTNPYYFFYPAQNNKDIITFFNDSDSYNLAFHSIGGISSALIIDDKTNIKEIAFKRLFEDVVRILQNPRTKGFGIYPKYYPNSILNPQNNWVVLNERAYDLFNQYSHLLGYKQLITLKESNFYYTRYKQNVFPVLIDEILKNILKLKIQIFLELKDSADINKIISLEDIDKPILYDENKINDFVNNSDTIPNIRIAGIEELEIYLNYYKKYSKTLNSPLPQADLEEKKPLEICENIDGEMKTRQGEDVIYDIYSKKQRNIYCSQWFHKMYEAYILYVEEYFPKIKDFLYTYSNLPLTIHYCITDFGGKTYNSLECSFNYALLMKQKHKELIKMINKTNIDQDCQGFMRMPPYPSTIEENAINKISNEIKNAYIDIALKEGLNLPQNYKFSCFW